MKKIIYTANIGSYDTTVRNEQKGWDCLELKSKFKNIDSCRSARRHKILPNFWERYDFSVWHDANIRISFDLNILIRNLKADIVFVEHGKDCIYQEAVGCLRRKKDDPAIINSQMKYYRNLGYPEHNGLIATGFMIRKHSKKLLRLMKIWWTQVKKFSKRDQLSFNYALWKCSEKISVKKLSYSYYTNKSLEILQGHRL